MDGEQRIMKIIVCIRSYNESKNIEKCCEAYPFADRLLLADGGSTDDTISKASKYYPHVNVREYRTQVELKGGIRRNPDGAHINFLLDWADEEGADWVIEQDCDQRPNKYLKDDARKIFEKSEKDFIQVTQLYLWGKDQYFPELSGYPNWMQGLWAWRASTHLRVIDKMPHFEFTLDGQNSLDINKTGREENILPPYCFLHYGWQTETQVNDHMIYYRTSGLIPGMLHPKQFGGRLAPLPEWANE
jgi:hypothetical protein